MADIMKCRKCRKVFHKSLDTTGMRLCPECTKQQEEDFQRVYHWIRDNPKEASLASVSEATGVAKLTILHWVRRGRLLLGDLTDGKDLEQEMARLEAAARAMDATHGSSKPKAEPGDKVKGSFYTHRKRVS